MPTSISFLTADEGMDAGQISAPVRTPVDPGSGRVRLFVDPSSGHLLVLGTFADLSSRVAPRDTNDSEHPSPTHLHAGAAGDNGGVLRHLHVVQNADLGGRFGTDSTLDARQMQFVTTGNSYALIHTVDNFGGEVRGQIDTFTAIAGILGDATAETIRGSRAAEVVMGLGGEDVIAGGAGDDVLSGGAGDDFLAGGAGSDWMSGGAGDDRYIVDDAVDQIFEFDDEGTDLVVASIDYTLNDISLENLTLTGSAAIVGTGNDAANQLRGNAADNVLRGLAGDDMLMGGDGADRLVGGDGFDRVAGGDGDDDIVGGAGRDLLIGGAGADVFAYTALGDSSVGNAATGRDVIQDFAPGQDRIDLRALGMTGYVDRFTGAAGEVRAYSNGRATFVQMDIDGDRIADLAINLVGTLPLTASDFAGF